MSPPVDRSDSNSLATATITEWLLQVENATPEQDKSCSASGSPLY